MEKYEQYMTAKHMCDVHRKVVAPRHAKKPTDKQLKELERKFKRS